MSPDPIPVRLALSDAVIDQLAAALGAEASSRASDDVHAALEAMCTEAHTRGLPPETLVLAIKAAWKRVNQPLRMRHEAWTLAYYALVGRCLAAYFSARD
jgi:hypothetical protein